MANPTNLAELATYLETATGIETALWAWDHAPGNADYMIVTQDEDSTFFAGGNAENAQRGFVDVFTRTDGFAVKATVEAALRASGWHWSHRSAQFESETRLTHHDWSVAWLG